MTQMQITSNPFAQMINPEAVRAAVECSERLAHLGRRICRPLDKPAVVPRDAATAEFDAALDESEESPE